MAHPAFSKMFVETEYLPGLGALLATRRRRAPSEPTVWAAHLAVSDGDVVGKREFETDRARFLGRGDGVREPSTVLDGRPLSGAVGTVLDPIFALRRRVRIAPGATARVDFWTMLASSREEVMSLVDKHHDIGAFERAGALAWTQAQVQLHHLGIDRVSAGQYQRLAGHMIYAASTLRPPSESIGSGSAGQPELWSLGISGDLPIILVRLSEGHQIDVARQALQAFEYWRMKRLPADLVILNERATSYVQDLQIALETLVQGQPVAPAVRRGAAARARLPAARRPDLRGVPGPAGVGGAGGAGRGARGPDRIRSSARPRRHAAAARARATRAVHVRAAGDPSGARAWSTSTAWAVSPRAGGNT